MLRLINDNIEIDMRYITCAEYQLFINEKIEIGEYHQPDHWKSVRHASEDADKPIIGVRASDAEAFCEWLTQREIAPGYKYRLPTLDEVKSNPCSDNNIGCWCTDEDQKIIGGIKPQQCQVWQNALTNLCNLGRDVRFNPDSNFNFFFNLDLTCHLDFPGLRLQVLALAQQFIWDYVHELHLINRLTQDNEYISTYPGHWFTIIVRLFSSIFKLIRKIVILLVGVLTYLFIPIFFLFRDLVFPGIRAVFSTLANILNPVCRIIRNTTLFLVNVLVSFFKSIVSQTARAIVSVFARIFEIFYDLFSSIIRIRKKDYSLDRDPEQILERALTRAAEFEHIYALALSQQQSYIRTNFRLQSKINNSDIFALLLSVEQDYLDAFRTKFAKNASIFSKNIALKFLSSLKIDSLTAILDFDAILDTAFTSAINRTSGFDGRDLYFFNRCLLIIATFYTLLSHDYKQEFKNRQLRHYQNFSRSKCQQLGNKYMLKSDEILKIHTIFLLIAKRYEGHIKAWEGIRIVRERIVN